MVLQFIKDTFSRMEPRAATMPVHDVKSERGFLTIGPRESTMPLTQLELLRDTYLKHGGNMRALVIGVPFNRVERTLASAGFDTTGQLHSLGATRRLLRFEDAETATSWTLAESELDRAAKPELRPGRRTPIAENHLFVDWLADTDTGMMRHRRTGRELRRPTHLIYKATSEPTPPGSYDGIHENLLPEVLFERLRDFGKLGLNAQRFLRNIITLVGHTRERFTSELFCDLVIRSETLMTEIEYLTTHLDSIPENDRAGAAKAIEGLMGTRGKTPPMAIALANMLREEIAKKRTPYSLEDFLTPGCVWHVPTDTHAEKQFAAWLKYDLQRRLLAEPGSPDHTLILVDNWLDYATPEIDLACLQRSDIHQVYGIPRPDLFVEKFGDNADDIIRAFHTRLWHATSRDYYADLLLRIYPDEDYTRQTLAYLHWERRLRENENGRLIEDPVALNIDGMETYERARRATLRAHQY